MKQITRYEKLEQEDDNCTYLSRVIIDGEGYLSIEDEIAKECSNLVERFGAPKHCIIGWEAYECLRAQINIGLNRTKSPLGPLPIMEEIEGIETQFGFVNLIVDPLSRDRITVIGSPKDGTGPTHLGMSHFLHDQYVPGHGVATKKDGYN
jgi:hypothetical protein